MRNSAILIGSLWGDEGKAKIVDVISKDFDIVVRFQGGSNAGHTIVHNDQKYIFHQIPSGMFYPEKIGVIGNGVVLNLAELKTEFTMLQDAGIQFENRFFLSDKAHLVLPLHQMLDAGLEDDATHKIGSTKKGIGPTYSDKAARYGVRLADVLQPSKLKEKLHNLAEYHHLQFDVEQAAADLLALANFFRPYIVATEYCLNDWYAQGKKILFEGAQGTLLDIDFGTYPYVTSSHPMTGSVPVGSGLAYNKLGRSIGIMKAYCTRVGIGAFPSELDNEIGDRIRERGNEFGSTTGRPRRCGWLDLVAMKYSVMLNGFDELALTLLDVLSGLDTVNFCTAYEQGNETTSRFPGADDALLECKPVWTELPGWHEDITACTEYAQLPQAAQKYVEFIETYLGVPITVISVGPKREQTIFK